MQLSQTKSGNYAKQITISAGGKWRFCGNYGTLAQAQAAAAVHAAKGRQTWITQEQTSNRGAAKLRERAVAKAVAQAVAEGLRGDQIKARLASVQSAPVGSTYFRVEAYIERQRAVMTHATAAECMAAGKTPGPMND
jgi:hypothetical protein